MASTRERTGITVVGRHFSLLWILFFTKLTVEIDGVPHVGPWRPHFIPATAGTHRVAVFFKYIGQPRCGEAEMSVTVPEGGIAGIQYRAPQLMTGPGKLALIG